MAKQIVKSVIQLDGHSYEDSCEWCGRNMDEQSIKIIRIIEVRGSTGNVFCSKKCEREDRLG